MKTLDEFPMFKLMFSAGLPLDKDSLSYFHRQSTIWGFEEVAENIMDSVDENCSVDELRVRMGREEIPKFIIDRVIADYEDYNGLCLLERMLSDDVNDVAVETAQHLSSEAAKKGDYDLSFLPSPEDVDVVKAFNDALSIYAPLFYAFVQERASVFFSQNVSKTYNPVDIKEKTDVIAKHLTKYKGVFDPKLIRKHKTKLGGIPDTAANRRVNLTSILRYKGGHHKPKVGGKKNDDVDALLFRIKENYSLSIKMAQRLVDMTKKYDNFNKHSSGKKKIKNKDTAKKQDIKNLLYFSGEEVFVTDMLSWGVCKPMGHPLELPQGRLTTPITTLETEVGTGKKTKKMNSFVRGTKDFHEVRHKSYLPILDNDGKLMAGFVLDCHVCDVESIILNDFGPLNQYAYSMKKDRQYSSDFKYGKLYEAMRDKFFKFFESTDPWSFSSDSLSEKAAYLPRKTWGIIDNLVEDYNTQKSNIFPLPEEQILTNIRREIFKKYFEITDDEQAKNLTKVFPLISSNNDYSPNPKTVNKVIKTKSKKKNTEFNRDTYKYLRANTSRLDFLLSTRDIIDYDLDTGELIVDEELKDELTYNIFFRHVRVVLFNDDKFAMNYVKKSVAIDNSVRNLEQFTKNFCSEIAHGRQLYYSLKGDIEHDVLIAEKIDEHYETAKQLYEDMLEGFRNPSPFRSVEKMRINMSTRFASDLRKFKKQADRYHIHTENASR